MLLNRKSIVSNDFLFFKVFIAFNSFNCTPAVPLFRRPWKKCKIVRSGSLLVPDVGVKVKLL